VTKVQYFYKLRASDGEQLSDFHCARAGEEHFLRA